MENDISQQREKFNALADNWDKNAQNNPLTIDLILKLTNLKPGMNILDIATGTGVLIPHLLSFSPKSITAIDVSENMLERAQNKFEDYLDLSFINQDFYEYSTQNKFDYLICFNAYPHFFNKPKFVQKCYELLKSDGRIVIGHDKGREQINRLHKSQDSVEAHKLNPVLEEVQPFIKDFNIDIAIDLNDLYILSGTKK